MVRLPTECNGRFQAIAEALKELFMYSIHHPVVLAGISPYRTSKIHNSHQSWVSITCDSLRIHKTIGMHQLASVPVFYACRLDK